MNLQVVELLKKVRDRGHDVYEAGPAKPAAVRRMAEEWGYKLPPTYVDFLLKDGSLCLGDTTISGIQEGDQLCNGRGTALGDTKTLRAQAPLPTMFLVIGPHEDGAYCLDFDRQRDDGECPVVNFEWPSIQHEEPLTATFEEWLVRWELRPLSEEDA